MNKTTKTLLCCLVGAWLVGSPAWGQNPNYTLSVTDATSAAPGTATVSIILDSVGGAVEAWSFSLCHDDTMVRPFASQAGVDIDNLNGEPPDFYDTLVGFSDGLQVIAILDFFSMRTLPPGTGYQLATVDYSTFGPVGATTSVSLCDTVGDPPTETLVVVNVVGEVPVQNSGMITIGFQDPDPPVGPGDPPPPGGPGDFTLQLADTLVPFDEVSGMGNFSMTLTAFETVAAGDDPLGTSAFSTSVSHDPSVLSVNSVQSSPALDALNGGAGPDFYQATLLPEGWNLGVVYDFFGAAFIFMETPVDLAVAEYCTNAPLLAGTSVSVLTELDFIPIGSPPVVNTVITTDGTNQVSNDPTLDGATVTLSPTTTQATPFTRGDVNTDGSHDIGDPIQLLSYLFQNDDSLGCDDAADANNDQAIDIADTIFLLTLLFDNGPQPDTPYPDCGLASPFMGCLSYPCP